MRNGTEVHTPASEDALAELVRAGRSLRISGSGTKQHYGPRVETSVEPVSLSGFAGVTFHEPGDLVVSVRAGTRLAELQAALAVHGQWLPIDPPFGETTIGGMIATGSVGPRRLGYGTVRDHLIGLRVMGSGGVVSRSGGRVVKNVSGYDLQKLHIGAFGSLGILLEANFKVRPRPEMSLSVVCACESVARAHEICLKVFESKLAPVALEAIDGRLSSRIGAPALAIVGIEGSRPLVDRHVDELRRLNPGFEVRDSEATEQLWVLLREMPDAGRSMVRVRMAAKPFDLPELLPDRARWIQAGSGVARVDLRPDDEVVALVQEWQARAAKVGGYAVVESAPLDMPNRATLPWSVPGSNQQLMQAIKARRDPSGVFNAGRVPW